MILFICKKNEVYSFVSYTRRSSGLFNSTRFIVESLNERGVAAAIVEVNDNNDIDRVVTEYKADKVVIEALWVVPEKFDVLKKLHPRVKWFCHMHSHMPFLAIEGIAMGWLREYAKRGIHIIANSIESFDAFKCYLPHDMLTMLANVYISHPRKPIDRPESSRLNIGCYGAIRPLKNHLTQALAAMRFAHEQKKHLAFHVNACRLETNGEPVLKNLRQLFENQKHAELVENEWFEPEDFINHLHDVIDIGMQVSLSETFNVVSADYVTAGIPIVTSKEVKWACCWNKASDESVDDIVKVMGRVWKSSALVKRNQKLLKRFSHAAQLAWFEWACS